MIGATMAECKLPMKEAVSRVLHYLNLTLTPEDSQKSEDDDEPTLVSTSSSSSSEDPVLPYIITDEDEEAAHTLVSLKAPPSSPSSYTNEADDENHSAWTEEADDHSDRPYTPLPEFPDGPTHYLDKEAGRWFLNAPEIAGIDHHYFPIPNDAGRLEDATYLRYEVGTGKYPLLHATHGPHKPTFNRLLRPRPVEVELRNAPYTPLQRRLFRHDEPFEG